MEKAKEEAPMSITTLTAAPTVNESTQNPKQPQQKQTAKEAIAANVQALIEQLEQGYSDALTAYLSAMGRFHTYGFLCCAEHKNDYVQSRTMLSGGGKAVQGAGFRALRLT
jgi:hypothetical protein